MDSLPVLLPRKFTGHLLDMFVPSDASGTDRFELLIRLKGDDISLRQLAAYLNFIDKAYGRLSPKGIINYSRSSRYELKVTEIRHGSLELVISHLVTNSNGITALILVGLLLKYLPGIIKAGLSAYRDYEEGKLAKARRQQIKEQIKSEENLSELRDRQVNQLCHFMDVMYGMDMRNLPKTYSFSKDAVVDLEFRVRKSDAELSNQSEGEKDRPKRSILF